MTEDQYARRTLSELVMHVLSNPTRPIKGLNYKTLAFRIGRRNKNGEGVAVGMGRILGKLGHLLKVIESDLGKDIPHIQCLAIDKTGKNQDLPGDGIEEFWSNYRGLTRQQKERCVRQAHRHILNFDGEWVDVLNAMAARPYYWVVSPNVRNKPATVDAWRRASLRARAAFMGWNPDDMAHGRMGPTFAGKTKHGVQPGDIILIARRHHHEPDIVGFGVVRRESGKRVTVRSAPDTFGSFRRLQPFVRWNGLPARGVRFAEAIRHTRALVRLHPEWNNSHRTICEWIEGKLNRSPAPGRRSPVTSRKNRRMAPPLGARIVASPKNHQLDYKLQTKARVISAEKAEAVLLDSYRRWLQQRGRDFLTLKYKGLQCDAFERERRNLIEAKSSARREHIRMAVGQLLDYAFQGKTEFGDPHKAILLPSAPQPDILDWLDSLNIKAIWRQKKAFVDNANGLFTR